MSRDFVVGTCQGHIGLRTDRMDARWAACNGTALSAWAALGRSPAKPVSEAHDGSLRRIHSSLHSDPRLQVAGGANWFTRSSMTAIAFRSAAMAIRSGCSLWRGYNWGRY
jgi:hypothetical protein